MSPSTRLAPTIARSFPLHLRSRASFFPGRSRASPFSSRLPFLRRRFARSVLFRAAVSPTCGHRSLAATCCRGCFWPSRFARAIVTLGIIAARWQRVTGISNEFSSFQRYSPVDSVPQRVARNVREIAEYRGSCARYFPRGYVKHGCFVCIIEVTR